MHHGAMIMAARDASEPPPLPDQPTDLTATPVSGTVIDLAWTDNATDELAYELEYDTDNGFGSATSVDLAADAESHSVTGLIGGTEYFFRVRASNVTGDGPWSDTASAFTLGNPPDKPEQFSALALVSSAIRQWWKDVGSEDEFEVQRAEDTTFSTNLVTDTVAANVETYEWTGLSAGTTYYTRVRANSDSEGSSEWASGEGPGAGAGHVSAVARSTAAQTAPSSPGITPDSATEVTVDWTDESGGNDTTQVQLALDASFTDDVKTVQKSATVTSHQFTGLSDGVQYHARARHFNAASDEFSDWTSTVTVVTGTPAAPAGHSVTDQQTDELTHVWTDPPNHELTDVDVELAESADFLTGLQQDHGIGTGTETKTWTSLTEGKQYWVRVRGVNGVGDGEWSEVATATQLAAPTNLAEADHGTFWRLTWDDNSASEDAYEIHRDTGGGYALFDTLAADAEQYDVAKDSGTKWKVRATAASFPDSDFSNEFTDPS